EAAMKISPPLIPFRHDVSTSMRDNLGNADQKPLGSFSSIKYQSPHLLLVPPQPALREAGENLAPGVNFTTPTGHLVGAARIDHDSFINVLHDLESGGKVGEDALKILSTGAPGLQAPLVQGAIQGLAFTGHAVGFLAGTADAIEAFKAPDSSGLARGEA